MSRARLVICVILPFAAGYFLSYLFRTINAVIANDLAADLNLGAADLGFLTSIYFLVLAAVQLPFGALLDRHGPKTIQSALLLLASAGALLFATAEGLIDLIIGRALLALGVALALMAGFKAIVLWFPPGRVVLANGWLVMLGALGGVTATAPAEAVVQAIGWRGMFAVLAGLAALAALLVLFAVPEQTAGQSADSIKQTASTWSVYRDSRFWRFAPLSAIGIGTSWSLQGLWAAPWLRDVEGLDRVTIVHHLSVMAFAVCVGALLLGVMTARLRRTGVKTEAVLVSTLLLSMAAQAALVLRWPAPAPLLWAVIATAGAATVLSFAILTEYFPRQMSGRANAALNLLHVGGAFVLQSSTGFIIEQWPESNGAYPAEAHQAAMTAALLLQLGALAWFAASRRVVAFALTPTVQRRRLHSGFASAFTPTTPYANAGTTWARHADLLRQQASGWRLAAASSTILCIALANALSMSISRSVVAIRIFEGQSTADIRVNPDAKHATTATAGSFAVGLPRVAVGSLSPTPTAETLVGPSLLTLVRTQP